IDMRDQVMRSGPAVHEQTKRYLHDFLDMRFPKISQSEKLAHCSTRPATVDSYLDLYDLIGEAIASTSDNHPRPKGGVSACSIEAGGLFHPIKLAKLAQTLIKTYRIVSITAHTARPAPFSFLTSCHASHLRSTNENIPPIKKQKKDKMGRSAMLGPERGIDERSSGPHRLASSSKGLASSELPLESSADLVVRKRPMSDSLTSCALTSILKRLFVRLIHEPVTTSSRASTSQG
ncbi:hypothetical protein PSHT_02608, partial [Puccinia striiformis]